MDRERLNAALNLMRRMPPAVSENTLAGLLELAPKITDDLLTRVDQPLQVRQPPDGGQPFVICEYNRDGDSYRSSHTNEYYPSYDGFRPRKAIRTMEELANKLFDVYRRLYFGDGAVSSVYFFDTDEKDETTFGSCWLVHNEVSAKRSLKSGIWDSIHVFDISPVKEKKGLFIYKLTTTVMISMNLESKGFGLADLSGARTQQDHKQLKVIASDTNQEAAIHVSNMGKMLEDNELRIRNSLERIYIDKTRAVVNGMRTYNSKRDKEWAKIAESLNAAQGK